MNVIYKIFFDKLNKNNSLGLKGSIEVYLNDNLKFLIGRKKCNIKVFIKELDEWIKKNNKKLNNSGFSLEKQKFYLKKLKLKFFINKFLGRVVQW